MGAGKTLIVSGQHSSSSDRVGIGRLRLCELLVLSFRIGHIIAQTTDLLFEQSLVVWIGVDSLLDRAVKIVHVG